MQIAEIKERAASVLSRHDVAEAYLFGSTVRREARADSDVDILVKFKTPKGLFEHVRAKIDLQDALGRQVDLVAMEALREEMKPSVDKNKVRIL